MSLRTATGTQNNDTMLMLIKVQFLIILLNVFMIHKTNSSLNETYIMYAISLQQ